MGAYVRLTVKYGYIILIRTTQDLCEQMANVDEKCPLKEGKMTIVKEVELPVEVPPVRQSYSLQEENGRSRPTNGFSGPIYYNSRRLHSRRRTNYLLDGKCKIRRQVKVEYLI